MARIPKVVGWTAVAASGYGVFWYTANRSIYYPLRYPSGYWEYRDAVGAADRELLSEGRIRLHAWWVPAPGSCLATLYLHGNGGNLTHRFRALERIRDAGSSVLIIDYRGYGKSEGRPTEAGLYADATAGYRSLRDGGYPAARIILHGESLGTAVAVDLAAREPCAGVILEAPFSSAADVARRILPVLGPAVIRGYDSRAKIGRVRSRMLIIHGDRDEVVPYELGRKLFDAARPPKTFWTVRGAHHNDLVEVAGDAYAARLRAFYSQSAPE
jgi:hypothetical protein